MKTLSNLLSNSVILMLSLVLIAVLILYKRQKVKYDLKLQQLDNKILRFQLKPHFVGNALVSIRKYIRENKELAEEYFDKYSNLMREVLISFEKDMILLEDEFSMLTKYMELESLRLKYGFEYEIKIEPSMDCEAIKVPPLILQPIVENAIWHGIADRADKGKISIHVFLNEKILCCTVENYCGGRLLIELKHEKKAKSFGLQITKERLKLLAKDKGNQWYLKTTPETNGMRADLGIPI